MVPFSSLWDKRDDDELRVWIRLLEGCFKEAKALCCCGPRKGDFTRGQCTWWSGHRVNLTGWNKVKALVKPKGQILMTAGNAECLFPLIALRKSEQMVGKI